MMHAVERAAGAAAVRAVVSAPTMLVDQRVDGRALDARVVAASPRRRPPCCRTGRRSSLPGVVRAGKADGGHVEVELLQALLVQREVDRARSSAAMPSFSRLRIQGDDGRARRLPCCPGIRAPAARPWRCAARRRGTPSRPRFSSACAPCAGCRAATVRRRRCAAARTSGRTRPRAACRAAARAAPAPPATAVPSASQSVLPNRPLHALVAAVEQLPVHPLVSPCARPSASRTRRSWNFGPAQCSARSSGSRPAACARRRA